MIRIIYVFFDFLFPFFNFLTNFATTSKAKILSAASLTSKIFICFSAFNNFSFAEAITLGFAPKILKKYLLFKKIRKNSCQ